MNNFFDFLTYCLRESKVGRFVILFIVGFILGRLLLGFIF